MTLISCPGCVGLIVTAVIIKKKHDRALKVDAADPAPTKIEGVDKIDSPQIAPEIKKEPEKVERVTRFSGRDDFSSAPPVKN